MASQPPQETARDPATPETRAGSLTELRAKGQLVTKVGTRPVVVVECDDRVYAIEDRCPHLGFPLHRGTVESGLVTCHWHHARFDLASGATLDPWADDAAAFDVAIRGDDVLVSPRGGDTVGHLHERLREGLEDGLTLVVAKSVLGLWDTGTSLEELVGTGLRFGTAHRAPGWGAGLTVLVAMANVAPHLAPADRPAALVHALAFLARDTAGHPPRFPARPLRGGPVETDRLASWYRRFVDTRSTDAAERVLATAIDAGEALERVEAMMMAAVTDHAFIDEGHTLDFTNKSFEALDHAGPTAAPEVLPTLVAQTCAAERSEETAPWRYPRDLGVLADEAARDLPGAIAAGARARARPGDHAVEALGWNLLDDDPDAALTALVAALRAGMALEQAARSVALAAGLRITRFHTQNDHADWNEVHHSFTAANALHASLNRVPAEASARGLVHLVVAVHLDRFLNIPAARLPAATDGDLASLRRCFDVQGEVETAAAHAAGFLRAGGSRATLIATLGSCLLNEDAEFHWYQVFEASVRQARAHPPGSEAATLLLAGFARFLAAHTPTRRELPGVIRIAARLRRGEELFQSE